MENSIITYMSHIILQRKEDGWHVHLPNAEGEFKSSRVISQSEVQSFIDDAKQLGYEINVRFGKKENINDKGPDRIRKAPNWTTPDYHRGYGPESGV